MLIRLDTLRLIRDVAQRGDAIAPLTLLAFVLLTPAALADPVDALPEALDQFAADAPSDPPPLVTDDGWVLQTPTLPHVSPWQTTSSTPNSPSGGVPGFPPLPEPSTPAAEALPTGLPVPPPPPLPGQPVPAEQPVEQPLVVSPRPQPFRYRPDPEPVLAPKPKRGKLHLDKAEIQVVSRTEEWTDGLKEQQHFRLIGSITNQSIHPVHKIRVHYRIRDGFMVRESGQFTIELSRLLQKSEYVDFNVPVTANGTLEIAFIDWKYEDGTQGISQRGVF